MVREERDVIGFTLKISRSLCLQNEVPWVGAEARSPTRRPNRHRDKGWWWLASKWEP